MAIDHTLIARLERALADFSPPEPSTESVGRVVRVGDGVVEIEGLSSAQMAEMILIDTASGEKVAQEMEAKPLYAVALNLEEETVRAVLLGDERRVREGSQARATGEVLSVPVGENLLGRVVSPLAEPLDGGPNITSRTHYPVERPSYPVIARQAVKQPLQTGITAIDAMIPIGRGQRELIIGDRFTGKTTVAVDTILNQRNEPKERRPICVYVSIGQKESKTARIVRQFKDAGAMEYTIVVDAPSSAPAALQFLAPFAASSMAEYFMEQGKDVLIVYDDLSKHAVAYRQVSLLLRRPPGREAYPGDIFYLHSRLLERAAKLSDEHGGGSITALPIIETQAGDVSAYIPTNVISITDGQIYLEGDLFNKGVRPAINVGLSVSRVGSSAQTKAMKAVASKMRIELAQFRELEAFAQFASDLDIATRARLEKGQRLVELLKQGKAEHRTLFEQVVMIYAANQGVFDGVPIEEVQRAARELVGFVKARDVEIQKHIDEHRDFPEAVQRRLLEDVFPAFLEAHPKWKQESSPAPEGVH